MREPGETSLNYEFISTFEERGEFAVNKEKEANWQ